MSTKKIKTKVLPNEFMDKPLFTIYMMDKGGQPSERPMVNIGITKVRHILNHLDELKKFADEYDDD